MSDYKGFMMDFRIADKFGEGAIRDTFNRAFKEWKNNVEYFASLVLTLNHQFWYWYDKDEERSRLYNELWEKSDSWGCDHFEGDDAWYYFRFLY